MAPPPSIRPIPSPTPSPKPTPSRTSTPTPTPKKTVSPEGGSKTTEKLKNWLQDRSNKPAQIAKDFIGEQQERQEEKKALDTYKKLQVDQRLAKAALIPREESASPIRFMFNPTDLTLERSVKMEFMQGARTARGLPKVNFGTIEPYTLNLSGILFDSYETGQSVFKLIQPLIDAVDFSKFKSVSSTGGEKSIENRRPPVFYFIWGEKNYMCCMVENLQYKLTMFLPNGTPVRAVVTIKLKEVDLRVANQGGRRPDSSKGNQQTLSNKNPNSQPVDKKNQNSGNNKGTNSSTGPKKNQNSGNNKGTNSSTGPKKNQNSNKGKPGKSNKFRSKK